MSTIESLAAWTCLPYPTGCPLFRVPCGINKDNYIVIGRDLHKYHIDTNQWTKIDLAIDFENNIHPCDGVAFDANSHILYILGANSLIQIQLNAYGGKISRDVFPITIDSKMMLILDNSLVVVGGCQNNSILKWNPGNKTFTTVSTMYNAAELAGFGMVYNNTTNCLLLIGGYNYNTMQYVADMLEFDMKQKKWNKLKVSLPNEMWRVHCTMAVRNKYVLMFGGYGNWCYFDDIYIYSIKEKTLKKSKIQCPAKSIFVGITVNDEMADKKTVFGFVRKQWKMCEIEDHYFPPHYLLSLIHSFYLIECVFLLDTHNKKHYKISTLDIV